MEISQDQVHSKEKVWTFTTYSSTNLPQKPKSVFPKRFCSRTPFGYEK